MSVQVAIKGAREVSAKLEAASKQMAARTRKAGKAAANVYAREMRKAAPKSKHHRGGKRLSASVRVYEKNTPQGAEFKIKPSSHVAHLIILGTASHRIPKDGISKAPMPRGGGTYARVVIHPGTRANPFVSEAERRADGEARYVFHETAFPNGKVL